MALADWRVMAVAEVPQSSEMLWPVLQSVAELGGSGSIGEIVETVIRREGFTDGQQAVLHNDGPETEIGYRLAWARTYLKAMGLLTNSARGVWALTDGGTALVTNPALSDGQRRARVRELWSAHLADLRKARKARLSPDDDVPDAPVSAQERDWKEQLLDQLMAMRPDGFERLASRLLREADFDSVNVTGKSGDGGIDGAWRLPARPGQLPGLLPVQALPGQRRSWRSPRLPRSDGRPGRQGPADHHRHVQR
jgi:restriction system protein